MLGLFEGAEIALGEFKKINFDFAAKYAMQSALKTLARLSVTETQLRDKLAAKHVLYDAIDDTVQKLKALNYLNDERYAADFVTSAQSMNKSRREAAATLRQRGPWRRSYRKCAENLFGRRRNAYRHGIYREA